MLASFAVTLYGAAVTKQPSSRKRSLDNSSFDLPIRVRTLEDLGMLAGVSAATASRALAGSELVSPATRERIQSLAREKGFVVNPVGRMLRTRRSKTFAAVVASSYGDSHQGGPTGTGLLAHLAEAAADRGYDLLVRHVRQGGEDWVRQYVSSGRLDGVFLIGDPRSLRRLHSVLGDTPAVAHAAITASGPGLCVSTDYAEAGCMAARMLLGSGRRRVLFLGNIATAGDAAMYDALRQELTPSAELISITPANAGVANAEVAAELFDPDGDADGVFAVSERLALKITHMAQARGRLVPDDLVIVAYDDRGSDGTADPTLTYIQPSGRRLAAAMCDLLIERLQGGECSSAVVPPSLTMSSLV